MDSQILKAMIGKASYGYNTFVGNMIGEIHQSSSPKEWFWINGQDNIADWVTRGYEPSKLKIGSIWQDGPKFLRQPENQKSLFKMPSFMWCLFSSSTLARDHSFLSVNVTFL